LGLGGGEGWSVGRVRADRGSWEEGSKVALALFLCQTTSSLLVQSSLAHRSKLVSFSFVHTTPCTIFADLSRFRLLQTVPNVVHPPNRLVLLSVGCEPSSRSCRCFRCCKILFRSCILFVSSSASISWPASPSSRSIAHERHPSFPCLPLLPLQPLLPNP
jgi:hypothetical protein